MATSIERVSTMAEKRRQLTTNCHQLNARCIRLFFFLFLLLHCILLIIYTCSLFALSADGYSLILLACIFFVRNLCLSLFLDSGLSI